MKKLISFLLVIATITGCIGIAINFSTIGDFLYSVAVKLDVVSLNAETVIVEVINDKTDTDIDISDSEYENFDFGVRLKIIYVSVQKKLGPVRSYFTFFDASFNALAGLVVGNDYRFYEFCKKIASDMTAKGFIDTHEGFNWQGLKSGSEESMAVLRSMELALSSYLDYGPF